MDAVAQKGGESFGVMVAVGRAVLNGDLVIPDRACGVVLFAHGSGSSRHSPRNRLVARELQSGGLATLLIDLLTAEEEAIDLRSRHLRFDVGLLARRLIATADWLAARPSTRDLPIGLFGASTGAAAALAAAAERPEAVGAVVSRGGRPDLAGKRILRGVRSPTLLIVGGDDVEVIRLNREALDEMRAPTDLAVVPGASHLFEEPGTLEQVAAMARAWFLRHLGADRHPAEARGSWQRLNQVGEPADLAVGAGPVGDVFDDDLTDLVPADLTAGHLPPGTGRVGVPGPDHDVAEEAG